MNFKDFLIIRISQLKKAWGGKLIVINTVEMRNRLAKAGLMPSAIFRNKTAIIDYYLHLAIHEPEVLVELKNKYGE